MDRASLYKIYENWPDHFAKASQISAKADHAPDYYDSVIFCGMGGSATSCDIIADIMRSHGIVPVTVLKGERMPPKTGKHSLVVVNSVSGNTKETIMMMKQASSMGAEIVCISSGGALKDIAGKKGHKHVSIPNLMLPRASLPYMVMPGLRIIDQFLEHSLKKELGRIHIHLSSVRKVISASNPPETNIAKRVADFFEIGFAFCLSSPSLLSAGTRFKNSLNENAKVHCLSQTVMEASHNEIVPFTFNDGTFNPKVLLLQWNRDQPIVKHRFDQIRYFFDSIKQPVIEVSIPQKSLASAIISAIYMLDFATIYIAVSRKIDPSPTPAIDILKSI